LKNISNSLTYRWVIFSVWVAVCCLVSWKSLHILSRYAWENDNASHIILVPLIFAWLIYTDRAKISPPSFVDLTPAVIFALPAALIWGGSYWNSAPWTEATLSLRILSLLLFVVAGFVAIFGRASAEATWFSFAFLGFAVPMPDFLLNRVIYFLQRGSAEVADWVFNLSGTPVLREGFIFRLPGFSIEVASECSGIRSSLALVILALLVAHFAFSRFWKKALFVCAGIVMMVVKNGVRIATLSLLAEYVDRDFLYGNLHHRGGVVFFLAGLLLLFPVYWLLRRGEETEPTRTSQRQTPDISSLTG
jgi:exosortase